MVAGSFARNRARNLSTRWADVPVFDLEIRDTPHVVDVVGDQSCAKNQGMGGDGHIEVLETYASTFQVSFSLAKGAADLVCPTHPLHLNQEHLKASQQPVLSLGLSQSRQPVFDFGNDGLWQKNIRAGLR